MRQEQQADHQPGQYDLADAAARFGEVAFEPAERPDRQDEPESVRQQSDAVERTKPDPERGVQGQEEAGAGGRDQPVELEAP